MSQSKVINYSIISKQSFYSLKRNGNTERIAKNKKGYTFFTRDYGIKYFQIANKRNILELSKNLLNSISMLNFSKNNIYLDMNRIRVNFNNDKSYTLLKANEVMLEKYPGNFTRIADLISEILVLYGYGEGDFDINDLMSKLG